MTMSLVTTTEPHLKGGSQVSYFQNPDHSGTGSAKQAQPKIDSRRRSKRALVAQALGGVVGLSLALSNLAAQSQPAVASSAVAVAAPTAVGTPKEYRSFVDRPDHFSISVPVSWLAVNPDGPEASAMLKLLEHDYPKFAGSLGPAATLAKEGVKFIAVDASAGQDAGSNVNVLVEPAPGFTDSDLPELASAARSEYESAGVKVLKILTVNFDGAEALKAYMQYTLKYSGTSLTVSETQYIVWTDNSAYVMTLTGPSPDLVTVASTFKTH
jgi:hypothetical protein